MKTDNTIETIHLADYLKVIINRKEIIVAFLVVTVALAILFTLRMPSIYKASSQLVIDKEQTFSPLTGRRLEIPTFLDQQLTFNTHFTLIKSKPVIIELIKELKLDQPGETIDEPLSFLGRIKDQLKNNIKLLKANIKLIIGRETKTFTPEEKMDSLVKAVQASINIVQVPETRLLAISVEGLDPIMTSNIANTLAKKYIEFDMGSRLSSSKDNLEWMNNEIYQIKKKLEDDEQKFHEYKQLNKLFSVEGKQKVINQKIAEFNNEYLAVRNQRLGLDAQLDEIVNLTSGSGDITHIRSIINNPAIDAIYHNLTELELERTRYSKVFKEKHPKMVQNSGEIVRNNAKLKSELLKEVDNLKSARSVLIVKENVIEKSIAEFESDALNASGKELRYSILQRNLITSQNLYDTLVSKVKESGIISSGASSNIRIVEKAAIPLYPVSPNKKKNILFAIILGLFGGVGLAFFLDYIDQSIRTEEDVKNSLDLPVLAIVPIADVNDSRETY